MIRNLLNRAVPVLDDWGHTIAPWWSDTWLGRLICDQAEYLITGFEEDRRF